MEQTNERRREREGKSATWKRRYRFPWNLIPVSRHLFHLSLESVTTIFTIFRRCINHTENTRGCLPSCGDLSIGHGSRLRNLLSYITRERVYMYHLYVCLCYAEEYQLFFFVSSSMRFRRRRHETVDVIKLMFY